MAITATMVKALREQTGLGMMDCKKALAATDGDLTAAIRKLREDGALKAAKKAGRTAAEGLLGQRVAHDGSYGVIVEVNIETDFAARNDKFIAWVARVSDLACERRSDDVQALLSGGLEAERETLVQEIGEHISLRRIVLVDQDSVAGYIHSDHRKAALVALAGGSAQLARELAMHVVATSPKAISVDDLDPDDLAREREILAAQAAQAADPDKPKSPEIVAKIVEGRLRKYQEEVCLLEQTFVKKVNDKDVSVKQLLSDAGAVCTAFVRCEVGEGIEKATEDFAAEVAAQVKGS